MNECMAEHFEKKVDCDCNEKNLRTIQLDKIKLRHEEWLTFLQDKLQGSTSSTPPCKHVHVKEEDGRSRVTPQDL